MEQPSWADPDAGGVMIRGALWLLQVVGEGNSFTKNELREAFPGVAQADRRIRDLRDYGWVIYSSTEDATLSREDQRFVTMGVPVWEPKARRANAPSKGVTAKERKAVLARDGYACTLCGIAGGEPYPDDPVMTAVLAVSTQEVIGPEGFSQALVTECKRCRSGDAPALLDASAAVSAASELSPAELRRLIRWIERGRRGATELDRAWSAYRRVAPEQRPEVADGVRQLDRGE